MTTRRIPIIDLDKLGEKLCREACLLDGLRPEKRPWARLHHYRALERSWRETQDLTLLTDDMPSLQAGFRAWRKAQCATALYADLSASVDLGCLS